MRKLLIVGVSAGLSASIPIVYQKDPELFHRLVRPALESRYYARGVCVALTQALRRGAASNCVNER